MQSENSNVKVTTDSIIITRTTSVKSSEKKQVFKFNSVAITNDIDEEVERVINPLIDLTLAGYHNSIFLFGSDRDNYSYKNTCRTQLFKRYFDTLFDGLESYSNMDIEEKYYKFL